MRLKILALTLLVALAGLQITCKPSKPAEPLHEPTGLDERYTKIYRSLQVQPPPPHWAKVQRAKKLLALPRGGSGDLTADVVIGKRDFTEIVPFEAGPSRLFQPTGIAVNKATGIAAIVDGGNSRIGFINLTMCYGASTCTFIKVLGQPDMYHSACNGDGSFQNYPNKSVPSASTLCGIADQQPSILESDAGNGLFWFGDDLYSADTFNNRFLKWTDPIRTDIVADDVWGQPNFTSRGDGTGDLGCSAVSASSLCLAPAGGGGGAMDSSGNLWLTDGGRHRILRFPPGSHTADHVFGRPDLASGGYNYYSNAQDRLAFPSDVKIGPDGRLYVSDSGNNRIQIFDPASPNGSAAVASWPAYRPAQSSVTADGLLVHEWTNAVLYNWTTGTQTVISAGAGHGIDTDAAGNVLTSDTIYGQDVFVSVKQQDGTFAAMRGLFQDFWAGSHLNCCNTPSGRSIMNPSGVVIAANQLIVSSYPRLQAWDNPSSVANDWRDPDVIAYKSSGTDVGNWEWCCHQAAADSSQTHLFVAGGQANPVIYVFSLPLTQGAKPVKTINSVLPLIGGGSIDLSGQYFYGGLAVQGDADALWLTSPVTSRGVRLRGPLTSAPVVDVVLGQTDAVGTTCNRGLYPQGAPSVPLDMLCYPGSVSIDRHGNLFVSDMSGEFVGNTRMLIFDTSRFSFTASQVSYATAANKVIPGPLAGAPAFDAFNRMVVGFQGYLGSRFPGVFNDPLNSTVPNAYLSDFYSWPMSAAFDDATGDLYVIDANRARVLKYLAPLSTQALTATPVVTTTPTPTVPTVKPSVTLTPTSRATPTPMPTRRPPHKKTPPWKQS